MAKSASTLNYQLTQAALLKCSAEQMVPHDDAKGGSISLKVNTEIGKLDGQENTFVLTVKVRMSGMSKETEQEVFFAESAYRYAAQFEGPAPVEADIDAETGERMLLPLYYLASTQCQDLAWRMGYPVSRVIPEIRLFKLTSKAKATPRRSKKTTAAA